MVGHHQLVNDHIVQIEEQRSDGGGNAHPEHRHNAAALGQSCLGGEGDDGASAHPSQHHQEEEQGHAVGQASGQTGAQHLLAPGQQDKHKEGVQGDVQQAAQDDTRAGLPGAANAADEVCQHVGQYRGNAADDNDTGGVLLGVVVGVLAGTQQPQQRLHEQPRAQGEEGGDGQTQVQREGADLSGLLGSATAQQPGDEGAAADARQSGQTQGDVEHGEDEGGGGHHVRIVGPTHKEGVRHVVDQHDQLAGHGGKNHLPQGYGDGKGGEDIGLGWFGVCLHGTTPELSRGVSTACHRLQQNIS